MVLGSVVHRWIGSIGRNMLRSRVRLTLCKPCLVVIHFSRLLKVQRNLALKARLNLSVGTLLSLLDLCGFSLVESLSWFASPHQFISLSGHAQASLSEGQMLCLIDLLSSDLNAAVLSRHNWSLSSSPANMLRAIHLADLVGQVEAILSLLGAPDELLELKDI